MFLRSLICIAAAGLVLVPVFAEETALESLERSRDAYGAVYPGKELLAEIKRELARGNNAAARRALVRARGTYGQAKETLLLGALLDTMDHNYRGALQSLGAVKNGGTMLKDQSERFRKAEKNSAALVRSHGRNYATSFAAPGGTGDAVYLPDRGVLLYAAGGVVYRYDTRSGAKAVAARPGTEKTFGMTASYSPEITAVAVKTDGRYVIRAFSESQPEIAAGLEKIVASAANNITPFLSLDGQMFIFASDRGSSRGGFDIYHSQYSDGKWSEPVNAGSAVNTRGSEINPWLHADSDTLFFSSSGREGFGGHDIYAVKLSAGTPPVNLGMPVNDIFDQTAPFSVDLGGSTIYQSADGRVTRMPLLYSIEAPSMRFVHGRITLDGKQADKAVAIKVDTSEGTYGAVDSMADGRYSMSLPYDGNYILIPASPGYLLHTEEIDSRRGRRIENINFNLPKIYQGMKMQYVVNFESASYEIPNREKGKLKELIRVLQDNPHIRFEISGHSSGLGTHERVERISKLRVASIMDYLLEGNINPRRLVVKAYGGDKKIAYADGNLAAQMSRRVEINIISWDESMTALSGGLRQRLETIREELNVRRNFNFSIPGYALAGAAVACFGTGGYYTYKSLNARADYDSLVQEYRDIPLSSWKVQSAPAYQEKMDALEDDYRTNRKYSLYAYGAGGVFTLASIIFFASDWFNRAVIKELEKEADTLQRVHMDFKVSPQASEVAFVYRF